MKCHGLSCSRFDVPPLRPCNDIPSYIPRSACDHTRAASSNQKPSSPTAGKSADYNLRKSVNYWRFDEVAIVRFCRGLQSESISEHCIDGGIHPWLQQRGATPGLGANLCNPGEISGDRGSSGSRPRVSTARNANGPGVMSRASNLERSLLNVTDCGRCRDHTAATAVRQRPRWDGMGWRWRPGVGSGRSTLGFRLASDRHVVTGRLPLSEAGSVLGAVFSSP